MDKTTHNPNGIVLYEGPSRIDGRGIVVVMTGLSRSSSNDKTDDMLQTWILLQDTPPHVAAKNGEDSTICGDCIHRHNPETGNRTCYVRTHQAPLAVWKAWRAGRYAKANPCWTLLNENPFSIKNGAASRPIRLGSYGDPGAVPLRVWHRLLRNATTWTGYTHQWRTNPHLRDICMASVDSPGEAIEAHLAGWRTFRVAPLTEPLPDRNVTTLGEVICPASEEGGHRASCATCGLCAGASTTARSIVIWAHGALKNRYTGADAYHEAERQGATPV